MHRRTFLRNASSTGASILIAGSARAGTPAISVLETQVISYQPEYYHGWPTVVRRKDGELWVSWSGGRAAHVCPFGQVVSMTSKDDGGTWTFPRVLLDSATDDRDSGVLETDKGTLLVTTFTSLAYEPSLETAEKENSWPAEKLRAWTAARDRLT